MLEYFKGSISRQTASKNEHVVVALPVRGSTERRAVPGPFPFLPTLGALAQRVMLIWPSPTPVQRGRAEHKKIGCLKNLLWLLRILIEPGNDLAY